MTRSETVSNQTFAFKPLQSILLLFIYFIGMPQLASLGQWLTKTYLGFEGGIHPNIALGLYCVALIVIMLIVWKPLFGSLKYFVSDLGNNLINVFKVWGLMMLGTLVIATLFSIIMPQGSQAGNQTVIESTFWNAPYFMTFNIVIFAPIVEEIIFRGVLYQSFRTKNTYWIAVIISCAIFALLHVIQPLLSTGDLKELLFFLQYAFMSYFMIIAYEKTGSIWGAILIHLLNNSLSLIQFFL